MIRAFAAGAGAGILGPLLFQFLARHAGPAAGLAATLGAALAAAGALGPGRDLLPGAAAALGAAFSCLVLLPAGGEGAALAAAALFLAASRLPIFPPPAEPAPGARVAGTGDAAAWAVSALAVAAACGLGRGLSLLYGHWPYAAAVSLGALAAGWAAGRTAAARVSPGTGDWTGPLAAAGAGVLGLLLLLAMKFLGLNAGEPERLRLPILAARDLLFIHGQTAAGLGFWWALIGFSVSLLGGSGRSGAAAGAAAGLLILRGAGPVLAAGLACLGLIAAGTLLLGRKDLHSVPSRAAQAALLLGALLLNRERGLFADVWLNRLNAAYPGGEFLFLKDDGDEALGAYRFASGATVLLSEGIVSYSDPTADKRAAHLCVLLHPGPKRILLIGIRRPDAILSALSHGLEVVAADPHRDWAAALDAQGRAAALERENKPGKDLIRRSWPPEDKAGRPVLARAPAGRLPASAAPADVILLEPAPPLRGLRAAYQTTSEAFGRLKGALAPGGILAVRLPGNAVDEASGRVAGALSGHFPYVGSLSYPGGTLLIASDREPAAPDWRKRLAIDVQLDDLTLEADLSKSFPRPAAEVLRRLPPYDPQTDRRPLNAYGYGM